ncbi:hypothetical protein FFF34_019010 [Inquilinus sp. KBS0705]|nr:hypothetical protein FFF34_019010 [Inquilinus sp. KBS0705]
MNKYQLQPYKGTQSRYRCPRCNHRTKTFTLYIDIESGGQLAPHVGLCDRVDNCGYHFTPRQYFSQVGNYPLAISNRPITKRAKQTAKPKPATEYYIHPDYVNDSFVNYADNHFVQYLITRFGFDIADTLVGRYRIGTSSHWHGATIFWQLDGNGYVRTGKIMLYNKTTGKRVKQPYNHITWAHTQLLKQVGSLQSAVGSDDKLTANSQQQTINFTLNQCLFGEHLLITSPYKPVAIVESEKTAIIASALMPAFIWLASGSLDGLNADKCRVLQNRQVMLFPDVNAYDKWVAKAGQLKRAMPGTRFEVSRLLEQQATDADKKAGVDLGDVLV